MNTQSVLMQDVKPAEIFLLEDLRDYQTALSRLKTNNLTDVISQDELMRMLSITQVDIDNAEDVEFEVVYLGTLEY